MVIEVPFRNKQYTRSIKYRKINIRRGFKPRVIQHFRNYQLVLIKQKPKTKVYKIFDRNKNIYIGIIEWDTYKCYSFKKTTEITEFEFDLASHWLKKINEWHKGVGDGVGERRRIRQASKGTTTVDLFVSRKTNGHGFV